MIKNLLFIGDSHTLRLRLVYDSKYPNNCNWFDRKNITSSCVNVHIEMARDKISKFDNIYFSGHKGRTGYRFDSFVDEYPCLDSYVNDETLVLPFFGYIDVKGELPKYKNPEETAKMYVDNIVKFFNKNQIQFIEPIPQFINDLGFSPSDGLFPLSDRYPLHTQYISALRKEVASHGLKEPISIEKILGTDLLNEEYECHDCLDCLSPKYSAIKLDHLKYKYNKIILDEILNIVQNIDK